MLIFLRKFTNLLSKMNESTFKENTFNIYLISIRVRITLFLSNRIIFLTFKL